MDLYCLRHMQTADNLAGILQGRQDTAIIPPGPDQMAAVEKNRLAISPLSQFDQILVSRLRRTHETARLYTKDFSIDPLLDELDFGPFEGRPRADLLRETPEWETDPSGLVLGEPLAALKERILAFFSKYKDAGKVLVFGHGAWLRAARAMAASGSLAAMNQYHIPNNQLLVIPIKRRPS